MRPRSCFLVQRGERAVRPLQDICSPRSSVSRFAWLSHGSLLPPISVGRCTSLSLMPPTAAPQNPFTIFMSIPRRAGIIPTRFRPGSAISSPSSTCPINPVLASCTLRAGEPMRISFTASSARMAASWTCLTTTAVEKRWLSSRQRSSIFRPRRSPALAPWPAPSCERDGAMPSRGCGSTTTLAQPFGFPISHPNVAISKLVPNSPPSICALPSLLPGRRRHLTLFEPLWPGPALLWRKATRPLSSWTAPALLMRSTGSCGPRASSPVSSHPARPRSAPPWRGFACRRSRTFAGFRRP